MTNPMTKWLLKKMDERKPVELEDVAPLHPNEYPARNLKAKLDERRDQMDDVGSHPTGMLDGPGAMT